MYITFFQTKRPTQITFNGLFDQFNTTNFNTNSLIEPPKKVTVWNPDFNPQNQPIETMKQALLNIRDRVYNMQQLLQQDEQAQYNTFYIPKHSGGLRQINAPKPELMDLLKEIKDIFEIKLKFLPHDRAFAYVQNRSTLDVLKEHQANESKWFLKLDIKNFFPNCTEEIILRAMWQVFPFHILLQDNSISPILKAIVKISLLSRSLPQGTPLSPLLTNLIMVHYDCSIYKTFIDFHKQHFIYTRYADDILISSKYDFDKDVVSNKIQDIINPFQLNTEKTRYGSSSGRNWNLGLMLNKDNNITIGYKNKQRLKATIFTFLNDYKNNLKWDIMNTQVLMGQISYYRKIEPDYVSSLIQKYEEKLNLNLKTCVKDILN